MPMGESFDTVGFDPKYDAEATSLWVTYLLIPVASHELPEFFFLASQSSQLGDKITSKRRGAVVFPLLLRVREATPLG